MSHAVRSGCATAAMSASTQPIAAWRGALRGMLRDFVRAWRHGAARREFSRLDANAVRDLGMSPSEFDSYWAEAHGQAEQTRLRVIQGARRRYGL